MILKKSIIYTFSNVKLYGKMKERASGQINIGWTTDSDRRSKIIVWYKPIFC